MEFDWWNTIQARETLPNVHVVQCSDWTLDIFFSVSCLACALWVKERKKHVLTLKWYKKLNVNLSYPDKSRPQSTRLLRKPHTITLINWSQNFWLMSFFAHSICTISKCCDMIGARYIPSYSNLIGARYIPLLLLSVYDNIKSSLYEKSHPQKKKNYQTDSQPL